ncbi:cleavage and polyadenylation specificity factor subunit 6-like isoform X2 [Narcine bancroftii]|uniref:cleavage and polyadenylation specificity factor subunit 6-like isoform X2 n=1 Tax=Narcine bancroftii TaxID=1343680 RepID=UPI0038312CF2
MGYFKMAVHPNMAGQAVHGLQEAEAAAGSSEQPENENQSQMDLYDDLIDDIIGVPLDNGLKPKKNNCNLLPPCSSKSIISPGPADPIKATPSKPLVQDKVVPLLPENRSLLIGNLTWWTSSDDLLAIIRSAGIFHIDEIKFYEVPKGGQSKGFAKVDLTSDWDRKKLMEVLPKKEIHGRFPVVYCFTTANRQLLEIQFIHAVKKSKMYSEENENFVGYDGNDSQFVFDSSKEFIEGDSTLQHGTPSPSKQLPVKPTASVTGNKLQPAPFISPNFLFRNLISLGVSPLGISGLGLAGYSHSQTLQMTYGNPPAFIPPTTTSLSALGDKKSPASLNAYCKDHRILGRAPVFQETMQSKKAFTKEPDRKETVVASKDENKEDFGSLLRLVSFVKKSKAVAQDTEKDCPPNHRHGGESKQFSSGIREHKYPKQRENWRSGERSGSVRERSRSPCSSDSHYQQNKMDYKQERHQRIHCEYSPRLDHRSERCRNPRDSFDEERACDSMRCPRNVESWPVHSEKSGKGRDYSEEKYFGIKQEKDREYQF